MGAGMVLEKDSAASDRVGVKTEQGSQRSTEAIGGLSGEHEDEVGKHGEVLG